ncbi:MAG: bifunctional 23S rRNA (guanine(2069)-N(7))-methyltransferase RlmK/23S rRNA (guanine(2445)-N(2))-methyltransferase RlmL [Cardiobacteriaceae bacterium]|nr:bifunctional 23S rRNA (guanine(2069)-N(7))-methyltransferase RlmK/23S rRNA (guanine(2445)-N(2))-methyltransferase RlmL [Cardiobacteriaceae bacterium]
MSFERKKIVLPCAKGSEQVVEQEAISLGLEDVKISDAVVVGYGDLICLYRICLWSRVASRVLLVLTEGEVQKPEDLYALTSEIAWEDHLSHLNTFAVRFNGLGAGINNSQFGALRIKDAIVDRIRSKIGKRPDVAPKNPDLLIYGHLRKGKLTLCLDISGGKLHKRGYRISQGDAPLKETLAALLLYRSGWHLENKNFVIDPMCGSGTLLIEALMMAADIAPAINRRHFGFSAWGLHHPRVWKALIDEAYERQARGLEQLYCQAIGFDNNPKMIAIAKENFASAGLDGHCKLEIRDVSEFFYRDYYGESGLIISNPPYGERIGTVSQLAEAYGALGAAFKTFPASWNMTLIANQDAFLKRLKLRCHKQYRAFNGAIEAKIVLYSRARQIEDTAMPLAKVQELSLSAEMFANRLRKNAQKIASFAAKIPTNAYRLYDRDLPEYAVSVDYYDGNVLVSEYAPPKEIPPAKAEQRLLDVLQAIPKALNIPSKNLTVRRRVRQSGKQQYQRLASTSREQEIIEGKARYLVNLHDYLDTGVFLDHRPMRQRIFREAADKTFLNLFCYTATATVQAALGGALWSTSVDLSSNYLDWAARNFELNGLSDRHRLIRADVMQWLFNGDSRFDLIFCDPPTFSNTKKRSRVFEVQAAHTELIMACMRRLNPNGTLYFSNNFRDFEMNGNLADAFDIEEISSQTIDLDFSRNPKIHRVWKIKHGLTEN